MTRSFALLLFVLGLLLASAEAGAQTAHVFRRETTPAPGASGRGSAEARVILDRAALSRFRQGSGGRIELPLPDGSSLILSLRRFEVLAPGAVVTLTGDRGPVAYRPDLTLFKGAVEGEPGSLAVLAMTSEQVSGTIERRRGRLVLAPLDPSPAEAPPGSGSGLPSGADHAIAEAPDLPPPGGSFVCPSDDLPRVGAEPPAGLPALPADVQATTTRLVCDLALDCDNDYFIKEGADSARAVNYALVMLGTASAIYEREINVTLRASYLNVWTTSDPYTATDLNGALTEFRNWWNTNRAGVSRDLAQLVSGRTLGGGIAYVGVLCNPSYGYSVIGNLYGQNTYPTNTTTWDLEVMAHELGHNFNSNHTHSCWWQSHGYAPPGALLDSCYAAEGSCYSGPTGIGPADLGTIMSYCHLLGGMANIRLDFHSACNTVMRNAAEQASCFAAAAVQPASNLMVATGPSGASLTWTASPSPGVIRYDVFRSPWQQDLAPPLLGTTTGTSFADLDLGTFWYKVRAVRAADSSAFSGEVKSTVCGPAAPVSYATGSSPAAALTADFDEDGILDLAVANFSSHNVSILRGLGSGGVGNGTFAAAVNYALPAGSSPAALATADFNGDGILDLAVAAEEAARVSILLGQGAGGVGNGGFAAGPNLTVAANPWAVVAGDFNADAIPDLAAACASGSVSILLGLGTGGVPNGTFAPRADYACGEGAYDITSGDFNSDGITDLAVAASAGVSVLPGQGAGGRGDGTFGARTTYACQDSPFGVATGDFDADGITDLAVANSASSSVSILLGNGDGGQGDGTFAPAVHYACGIYPYAVAVGDWNGDGAPDLVVSNGTTANAISILTGHRAGGAPDGTFAKSQAFSAGTWPRWVVPGDFDHDGQADFAVANNATAGQVSILLASCPSPLSMALEVTDPAGGEQWITGTQHTIRWTRGAGILAVDVALSRDGGVNWQTLASGVTDTAWTWNVAGPHTSQARIKVHDPAVPSHAALSDTSFTIIPAELLDAGGRAAPGLALRGAWPNPAQEAARVWFTLADGGPARLELLDLAGRRLRALEVGHLGPGLHHVDLERIAALRPGLYLLRLTQAGRHATGKLVVTR